MNSIISLLDNCQHLVRSKREHLGLDKDKFIADVHRLSMAIKFKYELGTYLSNCIRDLNWEHYYNFGYLNRDGDPVPFELDKVKMAFPNIHKLENHIAVLIISFFNNCTALIDSLSALLAHAFYLFEDDHFLKNKQILSRQVYEAMRSHEEIDFKNIVLIYEAEIECDRIVELKKIRKELVHFDCANVTDVFKSTGSVGIGARFPTRTPLINQKYLPSLDEGQRSINVYPGFIFNTISKTVQTVIEKFPSIDLIKSQIENKT